MFVLLEMKSLTDENKLIHVILKLYNLYMYMCCSELHDASD